MAKGTGSSEDIWCLTPTTWNITDAWFLYQTEDTLQSVLWGYLASLHSNLKRAPPQALLIKSIFIKEQKMAPFLLAGMLQTPDTSHCQAENKQRLKWEFILLRVREHEKCQRVKVFYIKVRFLPLCKSLIICDGKAARLPHSLSNCAQVMDAFQNQSR